jgi:hypothetical protein
VAGVNSPLFLLGLGGTGERAGFRSPLPVPPLGADAEERAGFASPLPFYFGYAGEFIPPEPEPVRVPSRGGNNQQYDEDEEVLAVIMAAALHRVGGKTH